MDLLEYLMAPLLKPIFGGISSICAVGWYISDLWLIIIIMQFIYINKNDEKQVDIVYCICFLLITLVNIRWSYTSPRSTTPSTSPDTLPFLNHSLFKRIFIRTSFGFLFHFCGLVYRKHIEKYQAILFTGRNFLLAFIIICQIVYYYGNDTFYLQYNADFKFAPVWLPILTSCIGIYLYIFIAKCASTHIADDDILIKIGNETYHIMCLHLLIYFFLNIIMITMFQEKNFQLLSSNQTYRYQSEKNWPLYVSSALLIPTFGAIYTRKFTRRIIGSIMSAKLNHKLTHPPYSSTLVHKRHYDELIK
ncbi:unnamed protein product [Adineta ricciae]|uniref:Uncharacterized protein n=1 Tax=Adineta ricciae TaxID=249248 RepID=A0A815RSI5_ADIRI|nr:unnamed protein product [Adineta ricciae]CAF1492990.1 unnamed protein product [Adineta ricciae]